MKMLRIFFGLITLAIAFTFLGGKAQAQENHTMRIINQTSSPIRYLYAAPASEPDASWGADLLGPGVMVYTNTYMSVNIHPEQDHCQFDLKAVLWDGRVVTHDRVDVCTMDSWTITEN